MRRNTSQSRGAERDRRLLDARGPCRWPRPASGAARTGSTTTMWASTRPRKVPPSPIWVKKRRKAMPSTTCGIISGDMKSAVIASRPRKSIARDGERGRHREGDARWPRTARPARGCVQKARDEFGIAGDGLEPAQRQAVGREREIALGREGDDADDQDRRQHEDDEQRVEDERQRAVAAHRNTSA